MKHIILFILPFVLWGCTKKDNFPDPAPHAKAESLITKAGMLEIGSENFNTDYGTITVPEIRSKPSSALIHIPFLRIHSSSEFPAEPIFGLAGGPGASNMSWDWNKVQGFLTDRDFVLVGYRGVDGSIRLDCPEVSKAFKNNKDILSEPAMKSIGNAWSISAERLKMKGIDLNGYTILQTVDDNESVRKGLGYRQINLLSESYGTRVAYLYTLKYPESINRSALICVNPPGRFVWDARTIDSQLKQYSALWAKDSSLTGRNPDLYACIHNVLNAMPKKWFMFPINPEKVRIVTHALLFNRTTAVKVIDAYMDAERGDPGGLALMSLAYDFVVPSMSIWGDLASKAVSADFNTNGNYCVDTDASGLPNHCMGFPCLYSVTDDCCYRRFHLAGTKDLQTKKAGFLKASYIR